jgi:hypothetical protein
VVLPDADLEFAADALIGAAYGSAGERCMAISAVVAVGAAGDPLVKLLEKKAKAIKLGVDMGPLVTEQHRTKVSSFIEKGVDEGAKLVVDAREQDVPKEGFYLGTSLFDYVTPDMEIYKNEILGRCWWFSGPIPGSSSFGESKSYAKRRDLHRVGRRSAALAARSRSWWASTCPSGPSRVSSFGGWRLFLATCVHGTERPFYRAPRRPRAGAPGHGARVRRLRLWDSSKQGRGTEMRRIGTSPSLFAARASTTQQTGGVDRMYVINCSENPSGRIALDAGRECRQACSAACYLIRHAQG